MESKPTFMLDPVLTGITMSYYKADDTIPMSSNRELTRMEIRDVIGYHQQGKYTNKPKKGTDSKQPRTEPLSLGEADNLVRSNIDAMFYYK